MASASPPPSILRPRACASQLQRLRDAQREGAGRGRASAGGGGSGERIRQGVDFLTYDVLDQNRMFAPKCLDEFPNLKAFMCRFEALEKIAAYMQSDRFFKMPVNNKMALWGCKRIC